MITDYQGRTESYFHRQRSCSIKYGPRGGKRIRFHEFRRNGKTRTYKRTPERYYTPVKCGFSWYDYVANGEESLWHLAEDCLVIREARNPTGTDTVN